jgi:hypothetical protein
VDRTACRANRQVEPAALDCPAGPATAASQGHLRNILSQHVLLPSGHVTQPIQHIKQRNHQVPPVHKQLDQSRQRRICSWIRPRAAKAAAVLDSRRCPQHSAVLLLSGAQWCSVLLLSAAQCCSAVGLLMGITRAEAVCLFVVAGCLLGTRRGGRGGGGRTVRVCCFVLA